MHKAEQICSLRNERVHHPKAHQTLSICTHLGSSSFYTSITLQLSPHAYASIRSSRSDDMRMPSIFAHDKTVTQPVVWVTTFIIIAFHIGALAAMFFFSWKAFLVAMFLWWVAGGLGIGIGYHRLLTHRGYKTSKWVEYFLTVC